jgi:phosphate/sulfate permease
MAILDSDAAERINKVRWQVGTDMLVTWGLTIPVTMGLSAVIYQAISQAYRMQWIPGLIVSWLMSG